MSAKPNQGRHFKLALGTVIVLSAAACGGGGGGGGDKNPPQPPQSQISLGGVVSKGRANNALVKVYGVNGDGSVNTSNVLATGQTDVNGNYSTSQFTPTSTYVVEVAARDCANTSTGVGCSSHADEKTGSNQFLPTGFKMRAVVTTTPSNKRVNITPFSEMAVAAAQAAGGLTTANANKGIAMANSLVGVVDLNAVDPTTLNDANATPDQQRLAAMLAAVSGVAGTGSSLNNVGCSGLAAGTPDATKCVVEKLAANASVSNYVGANPAVSGALNTELEAAVANSTELKALVEPATKKLTDPTITVPVVAAPEKSAIDKVKDFVNDMLQTFTTLLSGGNTDKTKPSTGAALDQARQFGDAVAGANFQGMTAQLAIQMSHAAAKLWTDYAQGGITNKVSIYGHSPMGFNEDFEKAQQIGFKCTLQDSGNNDLTPGAGAGTIDHVSCRGDHLFVMGPITGGSQPGQRFYHELRVTKSANDNYGIVSRALRDDVTISYAGGVPSSMVSTSSGNLVDGGSVKTKSSGAILATVDASNELTAIDINFQVSDGFKSDGTLVRGGSAYTEVVAHATGTDLNGVNPRVDFYGTTTSYAADGSTLESRAEFGNGSFFSVANEELAAAKFVVNMHVPQHGSYPESNLVGTLEGTRSFSAGANAQEYGSLKFNGQAYRGAVNSTTPFISGTVEFVVNDTNYNQNAGYSVSNYQSGNIFIDAFVTAPSLPKLRAIVGMSARKTAYNYQLGYDPYGTVSANFIAYNADGSAKRDAYVTFTPATNPPDGRTKSVFGDATNKIQFSYVDGIDETDVLVDGAKAGVYNSDTGRITFTDGSYMVPDFGFVVY